MTTQAQEDTLNIYHKRLMNSSRRWEIYKDFEYEYKDREKLIQGEIPLYVIDYINDVPNIIVFNLTKKNYPLKLQHSINYLKEEYGPDSKIYTFKINKFGNRWLTEKQLEKRNVSELENKINNSEHLQKFEDQFTPMKLRAYLQHELNFNKNGTDYYSKLFEDTIYNPVIKAYKVLK